METERIFFTRDMSNEKMECDEIGWKLFAIFKLTIHPISAFQCSLLNLKLVDSVLSHFSSSTAELRVRKVDIV